MQNIFNSFFKLNVFLFGTMLYTITIHCMDWKEVSELTNFSGLSPEQKEMAIIQKSIIDIKGANFQDTDGNSLLHNAIDAEFNEAVKFLLYYNADVNIKNNDGYTPLFFALTTFNYEVAEKILSQKKLNKKQALEDAQMLVSGFRKVTSKEKITDIKLVKELMYTMKRLVEEYCL